MSEIQNEKRHDDLIASIFKALDGKPQELVAELEAINGFLGMWSDDFGNEDEPRMALMCSMIADLSFVIAAFVHLKCGGETEPEATATETE